MWYRIERSGERDRWVKQKHENEMDVWCYIELSVTGDRIYVLQSN